MGCSFIIAVLIRMARTRKVNRKQTRRLRKMRKTQRGHGLFNSFFKKSYSGASSNEPTVVVRNPLDVAGNKIKRENLSRFNAYKAKNPLRTRAHGANVSKALSVRAPEPLLLNNQMNAPGNLVDENTQPVKNSRIFMKKSLTNNNMKRTTTSYNPLRQALNLSELPGRYP